VVSDVPVDDKASVVTLGIFRSAGAQSFGGAHMDRICVHVFIGCECACVLWASSLNCLILKKNSKQGLNYVMDVPCATAAWASASRHVRQAAGRIAWT